jgi:hypothetical protein
MDHAILTTAYFPPIQYISKFLLYKNITIETKEHYCKQSYRNRCRILGPNGIQTLSIPIVRGGSSEISIKEIKIDYSMSWQKNHMQSIITAYKSAPYFDYYIDDLQSYFTEKETYLFDLNYKILQKLLSLFNIETDIQFNNEYNKHFEGFDYRESIHPKSRLQREDNLFTSVPYVQVFSEKFDFKNNLSVIDLLMNEGPLCKVHIKSCIPNL